MSIQCNKYNLAIKRNKVLIHALIWKNFKNILGERIQIQRISNCDYVYIKWASLIAHVKNPPAMQETPVQFLGWEDSPGEGKGYPLQYSWAPLVAQLVKNLLTMWETWVWSLGWEDPLEKGKATHSSILAWRIPWTGLSLSLSFFPSLCLK